MTRTIFLTKGAVTVVDDEDFEWLSQHKWYATTGYAARWMKRPEGGFVRVHMHREIAGVSTVSGRIAPVDHINGDRLDNRRSNLRVATPSENALNSKRYATNTSGYPGVSLRKRNLTKPWEARVVYLGRYVYGGYFATPEEAAERVNDLLKERGIDAPCRGVTKHASETDR